MPEIDYGPYDAAVAELPAEIRGRCDVRRSGVINGEWTFYDTDGQVMAVVGSKREEEKTDPEPKSKPARRTALDENVIKALGALVAKRLSPIRKGITLLAEKLTDTIEAHNSFHEKIKQLEQDILELRENQVEAGEQMRFRGFWQAGVDYEPGSVVTHESSAWHCVSAPEKGVRPRRSDAWQKMFDWKEALREELGG